MLIQGQEEVTVFQAFLRSILLVSFSTPLLEFHGQLVLLCQFLGGKPSNRSLEERQKGLLRVAGMQFLMIS